MFIGLFKDIAKPHVVDLLMLLKRGNGMAVNELSGILRMSYMGVKQHCVALEKKGYLDTWRRPKEHGGRPEKVYRLTEKIQPFFPNVACDLVFDMLEEAERAFGGGAAERLLLRHFQMQQGRYAARLKGRTLLERAQSFAKLRSADGCVAICDFEPHVGIRLVEYHSVIADLSKRFPCAADLEAEMVGRVVQARAERVDTSFERVTRIEFRLKVLLPSV